MKRWVRQLLITLLLIFPVVFISLSYIEDFVETNVQGGSEGVASIIANMPKQAITLASQAGYIGIFALMLAEAAAFPIPSEIILPFAGYLVYKGTLDYWLVVMITTIAAIIGSYIDYFLGLKLGQRLLTNGSRIVFLNGDHLRKAETWFNRHGPIAVALFRLVPGARVLISFPAGLYRMNKLKFGAYTVLGCLPWNITLTYLGWWLGSSWGAVIEAFRYINLVAYGLIIILVCWLGWRIHKTKARPSSRASKRHSVS